MEEGDFYRQNSNPLVRKLYEVYIVPIIDKQN